MMFYASLNSEPNGSIRLLLPGEIEEEMFHKILRQILYRTFAVLFFAVSVTQIRSYSRVQDYMVINEEVREALSSNKPVVALESTILTHGMPFPDNLR